MKTACLTLAIAVVLISNAIGLALAARNRAGDAIQTIELTERELPLQSMGQDNSGVGVTLDWNRPDPRDRNTTFARAKLEEVGFDFRIHEGRPAGDVSLLPRAAYVALEYQGRAYDEWLQRVEADRQSSRPRAVPPEGSPYEERDPHTMSRLFPVDAGKSAAELRRRYPDQSRYLIVQAVVGARIQDVKDSTTGAVTSRNYIGSLFQVIPSYVNVPRPYAALLSPLKPQMGKEPRYSIELSYGRNLEPWVTSVKIKP